MLLEALGVGVGQGQQIDLSQQRPGVCLWEGTCWDRAPRHPRQVIIGDRLLNLMTQLFSLVEM